LSAVRFSGVNKSFGGRRVLNDLSFEVGHAEVYGLLGPNGCGKSTAINILCDLLDPDGGIVEIGGRPASMHTRDALGFCPQEIALYRDLYPAENLRFFADLYGLARRDAAERVAELMRDFALDPFARTRVAALSGGWQRRVNIAVSLVNSPKVLILDEPTSALDLEARHELWTTIDALKRGGMTILLTTHHLDEAERLCSRIGVMKEGRIVREGSVEELLALVPASAIALVEASDRKALTARVTDLGWGFRTYAGKFGCLLPRSFTLEELVLALKGVDVTSVSLQPVTLEHAYIEILGAAPV
jgi:ABC-2 type transport system ATP-binding protein